MKIEQINETLANYAKLIELAESVILTIDTLDKIYDTGRGIETISFEDDRVIVTCDDTCCGDRSSFNVYFPIKFLTMNEDELKQTIINDKELRLEREQKIKEEKHLKEKKRNEELEFLRYQQLKEKFEKS